MVGRRAKGKNRDMGSLKVRREKGKKVKKNLNTLKGNQAAYWEEVLRREGLSMGVGTSSKLSYAGGSTELEFIHGAEQARDGRLAPKKQSE